MSTSENVPIPLVTVGGFLGAGKTTLVNHILKHADDRRIVVFVNDFGAINIDYDLIEAADTDRISLKNGCVCCTLNDDLIGSIAAFCREDRPDAFVVEASGVADPRSLDQSIIALQSAGHVHLDNRVYVMDADQFGSLGYADTEQLVDYAVASDLVLINKADLAAASDLQKLHVLLKRSCPRSALLETIQCAIPFDLLVGDTSLRQITGAARNTDPLLSPHALTDFVSWSRSDLAVVKKEAFVEFLPELVSMAIRSKGILYFDDDPETPFLFDLVGTRYGFRPFLSANENPVSSFVAIGKKREFQTGVLERMFNRFSPTSIFK